MIQTFEQFINENYIPNLTLILEDHKFDANPGEDFDENWEKLDKNDRIYKYVTSKFPKYSGNEGITSFTIMDIYKVPEHFDGEKNVTGYHYVLYVHGGENGNGDWKKYIEWIKCLFSNFDDAWLIDLENDVPDDVWTMRLGFTV